MKIHFGGGGAASRGCAARKAWIPQFAPGLGAEIFGTGQRARFAELFQLEQHRRQPGHAQRGGRALATVRNVPDVGGLVRAHGVLDFLKLLLGLRVKQIHQFAHAFQVALGQIRQPGHFHRRLSGRSGNRLGDCGGNRGIRHGCRLGGGDGWICAPSVQSCCAHPPGGSAWPDNRPCLRRRIFRGPIAGHARSWR